MKRYFLAVACFFILGCSSNKTTLNFEIRTDKGVLFFRGSLHEFEHTLLLVKHNNQCLMLDPRTPSFTFKIECLKVDEVILAHEKLLELNTKD